MAEAQALRPAPPLPATRGDLLNQRKLKSKRTINDLVEDILVRLWDDESFMKLVEAIYDSQAIEGSMADDDVMAAIMIRDQARKDGYMEVAEQNVHTVKLAMRVGLKRYGIGRHERYEQVNPQLPLQ